jgi:hypothetical protein
VGRGIIKMPVVRAVILPEAADSDPS